MLEKIFLTAMGKPSDLRAFVRDELDRLQQGGYLPEEDLERIASECVNALEGRVEAARSVTVPLLKSLGGTVREVLDIPSRSEILALTEELRRHRRSDAEA